MPLNMGDYLTITSISIRDMDIDIEMQHIEEMKQYLVQRKKLLQGDQANIATTMPAA